jgi:hypothetical protein
MEPILFQTLPTLFNLAGVAVFLQIGIILFLTGRRHLRWLSVASVSLLGSVASGEAAVSMLPSWTWVFIVAGLIGGAFLGYMLRPIGLGLALAYIGSVLAAQWVPIPFVQYAVAIDLFAFGLLLTDLAPTLVSSLLAASIVLTAIMWTGASAPAALVLASGIGASRVMASILPTRLALWMHHEMPTVVQ